MEHPFAPFIRMLGKGQHGSRDLSQAEAEQSMSMVLNDQVEPIQLGAFLMLMRIKEETAEEVAGFVQACRKAIGLPYGFPQVSLDWASYAGKRRQLPWYVLSALLLSSPERRVLMHGLDGGIEDRVFVPQALTALGLQPSKTLPDAASSLQSLGFAFVPLETLNAELYRIINLKPLLGLRSPVHTIARMLNPAAAPASIMGIFHPGYDEVHQQASQLLGDAGVAVFKGEGGEAEINPDTATLVRLAHNGALSQEEWPAQFATRHMKDSEMDVTRLAQLWRGEIDDEYGAAAVIGTAAVALRALGEATAPEEALQQARALWQARDKNRFNV
ncbi:MAG: glycosyl transferase family protein [Pseudomonadota bacterium]